MSSDSLFLTHDEIIQLTALTKYSAQIKWLRAHGFTVIARADGKPVISRAHVEAMMGVKPQRLRVSTEPDWSSTDVAPSASQHKPKAA